MAYGPPVEPLGIEVAALQVDRERPVVQEGARSLRAVVAQRRQTGERVLERGRRLSVPAGRAIRLGHVHRHAQVQERGAEPLLESTRRAASARATPVCISPEFLATSLARSRQKTRSSANCGSAGRPASPSFTSFSAGPLSPVCTIELARAHAAFTACDRSGRFLGERVRPRQLARPLVLLEDGVLPADRDQDGHHVLVRVDALALHEVLGAGQELARGEPFPGGSGVRQKECVQVVDRLGATELTQREVALLVRPPALGGLERRRARRTARLRQRAGETGRHGEGDERGGREAPRIAAHELPQPVGERVGAGEDRLLAEVAAQVFGERGDRRVALLGALLEGLGDDGVEVAPELAPQALGRRRALSRGREERLGRRGARIVDEVGRAHRVGLQDRPQQAGRRGPGARGGWRPARRR